MIFKSLTHYTAAQRLGFLQSSETFHFNLYLRFSENHWGRPLFTMMPRLQMEKQLKTGSEWLLIIFLKCPRGMRVFSFRLKLQEVPWVCCTNTKSSQVQSRHKVPEEPDSHWSGLEVDQSSSATEMWCMMVIFRSGLYTYTDTSDYCVTQSDKASRPYHRGYSGEYCSHHE